MITAGLTRLPREAYIRGAREFISQKRKAKLYWKNCLNIF